MLTYWIIGLGSNPSLENVCSCLTFFASVSSDPRNLRQWHAVNSVKFETESNTSAGIKRDTWPISLSEAVPLFLCQGFVWTETWPASRPYGWSGAFKVGELYVLWLKSPWLNQVREFVNRTQFEFTLESIRDDVRSLNYQRCGSLRSRFGFSFSSI